MSRNQNSDSITRYPRAIKRGILALPLFPVLLLSVAFAESKGWLQQGREVLCIFISLFVTAFVVGRLGSHGEKLKRLSFSLCSELGLVVLILFLGLFTKDSPFFNILLLWSFLTILSGAFLSAALSTHRTNSRVRKKKYNK